VVRARTTVTFLGTSALIPGPGHDTTSFVINGKYLVDTGWYAALKMLNYGLSPLDIEYLFVTHWHRDHSVGLPQLIFYRRAAAGQGMGDLKPLPIVGPPARMDEVITGMLAFLMYTDEEKLLTRIRLEPGQSFETDAFHLATCANRHTLDGLVCRFTDKATGAVIAFTGDTAWRPPIIDLVRGADLLIHDATYGPEREGDRPIIQHSGAPEAAEVAQAAGVKRLALVHSSPDRQALAVAKAKEVFPNSFWPQDGETVEVG
jgi:ribonuclease BN (tRNA processing enzyme)